MDLRLLRLRATPYLVKAVFGSDPIYNLRFVSWAGPPGPQDGSPNYVCEAQIKLPSGHEVWAEHNREGAAFRISVDDELVLRAFGVDFAEETVRHFTVSAEDVLEQVTLTDVVASLTAHHGLSSSMTADVALAIVAKQDGDKKRNEDRRAAGQTLGEIVLPPLGPPRP